MSLEAIHIDFDYADENKILSDVNVRLKPREIISVVGPSGAGKSTLLKCLAGLLPLKNGKIIIDGEVLPNPNDLLKPGHPEIAIVNQLFELDNFFTVTENIDNQLHHLTDEIRERFLAELIDVFELNEIKDLKSKDISGGEKQRVTMACALAKEPKYLLLDEPFVHFDFHLHQKIGEYLKQLVELRGMGVILVTHNGAEALAWSDKILLIREGKITRKYSPQSAYLNPKNLFEGRFFGELNSIYHEGKQILFRPTQYFLEEKEKTFQVKIKFLYSNYRGYLYANYFKLENGRKIVLYSSNQLENVDKIYVQKNKGK